MMNATQEHPTQRSLTARWQTIAPVATLIFLPPVLTELLMGAVRVTNLWLLLPEMGVYGLAALLIREVTRRNLRGWGTILLLGIAYALAEECVILQTSLTPQFFPPSGSASFGWAFGVQWFYLLAMLGYESVYAIVLPICLTEILFPHRRDLPWLDRRGLVIALTVFLLSSVGVWWLWSHIGLSRYGPSSSQVPLPNIGLALLIILLLVLLTLRFRPPTRREKLVTRQAWSPWLLFPIAFILGLFWWILVVFAYIPSSALRGVLPIIPLAIGLAWALLALLVVRHLSAAQGWQDRHRLALIFGAVCASMLGGVLTLLAASPIDKLGKLIFDLIALLLLALLAWSLSKQRQVNGESLSPGNH